jgi:predicted nucleotidyltransferase
MFLRNKDKERLLQIFALSEIPIEVLAHGSRVDGTSHDGSDLDLVVRAKDGKKLPIEVYIFLKEKIKHSNIPILVEFFDWYRLPENFQKNILNNYEILFNSNNMLLQEPSSDYKNPNEEE